MKNNDDLGCLDQSYGAAFSGYYGLGVGAASSSTVYSAV
jgi:hypothetical protein